MQITIDVNSQKTATKRGISKETQKPYEITTQRGFLHQPDTITGEITLVAIDLTLERDAFPYDMGRYTLDASSLRVNQYGSLSIGRVKLSKLAQPSTVKAAA